MLVEFFNMECLKMYCLGHEGKNEGNVFQMILA